MFVCEKNERGKKYTTTQLPEPQTIGTSKADIKTVNQSGKIMVIALPLLTLPAPWQGGAEVFFAFWQHFPSERFMVLGEQE